MAKVKTLAETKVPKWKPFMTGGQAKRWKKEGSPQAMLKMRKKKL